ncbi:hypothetical protein BDZ91DRAFT_622441, partial [Kalaharituber pfeilii]
RAAAETINVGVYFHVIASGRSLSQGYLPRSSINTQLSVLNRGFAKAKIKFWLKDVTYTINAGWANSNGDPGLQERQKKLRRGDYRALNIFVIPGLTSGGRCTFPGQFSDANLLFDRCEVGTLAFPGAGAGKLGRVTIHEVGHWFGLLHTFDGGCDGVGPKKGDLVEDTPAHKHEGRIARCPKGKTLDSCPKAPGKDPVHNYMSYFEEGCWNEREGFTKGQVRRMR